MSQKGCGSTPDLASQSALHVCLQRVNTKYKPVCDVEYVIDPVPFWLSSEQRMLGFSQVLRPIKCQDFVEERKNGLWTGAKIHFREKNILGLGAL